MDRMHAAAVALAVALAACDAAPPVELGACIPDRVRHVERFGYYGGAPWLTELSGYSNLTWGSGAATLADARAAGIQAMVSVEGVFQIAAAIRPGDAVIAGNWGALAAQLLPDVGSLAALYVADEPYLGGQVNGVAPAEIQRRLEAAATLIHSTAGFETVRLAIIFSDQCLDVLESGQAGMPAGYAWVGWDLYAVSVDHLQDHVDRFLRFVGPGQRMIAVPEAFVWTYQADELELIVRIGFWLAWIEAHPQVVAVTPFRYESWSDGIAARDLPMIRARYEQIGRCILGAQR